eukprot:1156519-Pelagomonas_calceolata.AAC.3
MDNKLALHHPRLARCTPSNMCIDTKDERRMGDQVTYHHLAKALYMCMSILVHIVQPFSGKFDALQIPYPANRGCALTEGSLTKHNALLCTNERFKCCAAATQGCTHTLLSSACLKLCLPLWTGTKQAATNRFWGAMAGAPCFACCKFLSRTTLLRFQTAQYVSRSRF